MSVETPVRRWAVVLHVLTIVAIVVLCVALAYGILFAVLPDTLRAAAGLGKAPLSTGHHAAVAVAGALPSFAILYVLARMRALFALYARGEMLTVACADQILRTGAGLLAALALDIVSRPLQVALASLANPPGDRVLAVSLAGADLGQVLAGGLMIVIGLTLRDAARIAEENRGFV